MIRFWPDSRSVALQSVIAALIMASSTMLAFASEPVEFNVGETRVFSLALSPNGQRLAVGTGGQSPTTKIFDIATRNELLDLPCARRGAAFSVAFHPDGKRIAIADYDLAVTIRDLSDGSEIASLPGDPERKIYRQAKRLAYSPDGKLLAVGYSTGDIFVWDVDKKKAITKFSHGNEITAVAISSDQKSIATGTAWGLRVWDASDGKPLATFDQKSSGKHEVQAIRFLPDGRTVVTADSPGWIRTHSIEEGTETGSFKMPSVGAESTIHSLEIVNNGKTLLAPGMLKGLDAKRPQLLQPGLMLIDAKSLTPQSFLETIESRVMAVSPDGKKVALGTGNTGDPVTLHELSEAKPVK